MDIKYLKLPNGVIRQETISPPDIYNLDYVNLYNPYGDKNLRISYLRLGYLMGVLGKIPDSLLDIGYGRGDFLQAAKTLIPNCFGHDITGYPIPQACAFVEDIMTDYFEVITFFDSLEHFPTIDFIKDLKCKYIMISVPWCHYFSEEWFMNWKHRRPDEHFWHFSAEALVNFFKEMGYTSLGFSNIEDAVRQSEYDYPNILTAIFIKNN